ncbi:hypothetical protein [Halomicrobium salinisoli]|uniref:hypothetical protein n=1 Tax=Halomicrobium salinisoli TaxID=2878391 RepID=UPI001CF0BC4A|nr:hypothetical protein [Halomicrobium salinisoli]
MRPPHQSSDRTVQHSAPVERVADDSGGDATSECDGTASDRLTRARRLLTVAKLLATTLAALVGVAKSLGLL